MHNALFLKVDQRHNRVRSKANVNLDDLFRPSAADRKKMLERNLLFYFRVLCGDDNVVRVVMATGGDKHYDHLDVLCPSAIHSGRHSDDFYIFLSAKLGAQIPNAEQLLDHTSGRVVDRCRW